MWKINFHIYVGLKFRRRNLWETMINALLIRSKMRFQNPLRTQSNETNTILKLESQSWSLFSYFPTSTMSFIWPNNYESKCGMENDGNIWIHHWIFYYSNLLDRRMPWLSHCLCVFDCISSSSWANHNKMINAQKFNRSHIGLVNARFHLNKTCNAHNEKFVEYERAHSVCSSSSSHAPMLWTT